MKDSLKILHEFSDKLLHIQNESEIYFHISKAIKQIHPNINFIVSKLQDDDMNFRITESFGFEKTFNLIKKLTKKNPYQIDFPFKNLSQKQLNTFHSGKIHQFNGLYELVNGTLNKTVCNAIESLLNINEIYAISFIVDKKYFGGMTFLVSKTSTKQSPFTDDVKILVETIANQASTLIHRIRSEKELQKKEKIIQLVSSKLEIHLENTTTGFLFQKEDRINEAANNVFCKMFDIPDKKFILKKDCREALKQSKNKFSNPDEFLERTNEIIEQNVEVFNQEIYLADGRTFQRDFIPLNETSLNGFLWQYRDISEQKKQTEDLKRLNLTKDKFFSIIAHDLKSPFNALLGLTDILTTNYNEFSDEKKLKYIGLLQKSAQNTFQLTKNLLQWAQLQKGHLHFEQKKLNLFDLIHQTLKTNQSSIELKNLQIVNEVSSNYFVKGDEDALRTVFRNILTNAIKYTETQGIIKFSSSQKSENRCLLHIKDSGIGIAQQHLQNLFRIDKTLTTPGLNGEKGTGLGLILCKELLEKNNSFIFVESEPGCGTTFILELPFFNTNPEQ